MVLNQPWTELSCGQAQRVSIAIAIALKPSVLLLDEPTSNLDSESIRRVENLIKHQSELAVIWVTHDPGQAIRLGSRILELPFGTVSASLPFADTGLSEHDSESIISPSEKLNTTTTK